MVRPYNITGSMITLKISAIGSGWGLILAIQTGVGKPETILLQLGRDIHSLTSHHQVHPGH